MIWVELQNIECRIQGGEWKKVASSCVWIMAIVGERNRPPLTRNFFGRTSGVLAVWDGDVRLK